MLLEEYRQAVQKKGRAVFIAVCRGKLSEGIDFIDNAARCVIMAGIPYPLIFDPKVVTKKDYLDRKYASRKSTINGNSWYKLQACRAVNQAIGRVIRHVDDYGVIILMDERYRSHNVEISKWLQAHKKNYGQVSELERDLKTFFAKNGHSSPEEEVSFQKANKMKQAQIKGFMTKKTKRDEIKI
jgi:Rad3-related DNA helicase